MSASGGCPTPAGAPLTRAPGAGRTVALTFDDGPGQFALPIANVLRQRGVPATFFDTGAHEQAYPDVVRRLAAMGFLLGAHSWDHLYPQQVHGGWSVGYVRDQIHRTAAQQRQLTGQVTCFFRPPGGFLMNVPAAAAAERESTVLWSVDTLDWKQPAADDPLSVARITAAATTLSPDTAQHPIVLMHCAKASHEPESTVSSYRGNTLAALPAILDWYAAHGYRFVDLLGRSQLPAASGSG